MNTFKALHVLTPNFSPHVTSTATFRHFLAQYCIRCHYCLCVIVLCFSVAKMPRDAWCDVVTPGMLLLLLGWRHMLCRCNFTHPATREVYYQ